MNQMHTTNAVPAMNQPTPSLNFSDILSEDDILLAMQVSHKGQLFDKVANHLSLSGHAVLGLTQINRRLTEREALGSTALGQGVAIPHARIPGLNQAKAVFVRPHLPMAFDAPDGKPVSSILILLVPEFANEQHLQLLAHAAQLFCDKTFREKLRACADVASVHQLLTCRS